MSTKPGQLQIEDTPLEGAPETPALREHRLYQADYLIRRYGFAPGEIVFAATGNLPLSRDPKLKWALAHPEQFPVEMSTADRSMLLRVPGLGPKTVERIIALRRDAVAVGRKDLARLGAFARRAASFLAFRGRRLGDRSFQDELFPLEQLPDGSRKYSFSPGTFR